jgi:hypothetical protein
MRLTDGRGIDVAIEALGAQSTFESALRVLRPGGTRRPTALSLIREASGDALDLGAALFDADWRAVAEAREKGA